MFENLKKRKIKYNLKISKRANLMRLEVRNNGSVNVVVPKGVDYALVERFITEKLKWIIGKLNHFKLRENKVFLNTSRREYLQYKERARLLAESRIEYYNTFYNFRINRISIKNTKSRWGSCSKKGNLNFNYKIALLPENLADYVIVHELCHLGEFNHSKRFWKLVSLTIPNYLELKNKFKN